MVYDVLDIARYVIKYSNDRDYGVSNLKLQKILYFIQAYFLIQTNSPCFKEGIETWDFVPVVPAVYKQCELPHTRMVCGFHSIVHQTQL